MIHSSYFRPRVYPYNGDVDPVEIDRLQELSGTTTLNRTKIQEIGRDGIVDWRKSTPTVNLTLRQLEYGSLEFFRKLSNKSDATTSIVLTDFKTSAADIAGYKTDDDGTFLGTIWYPQVRMASFGLNIGDPDALVERSFSLVGEDEIVLLNNNKYLCYDHFDASGGTNETFSINNPNAIEDPDNSGYYLFRVMRVRSGVTTELTYTTDYTYSNATKLLTVLTTTAGDVIKVYYSAGTYPSGETVFTNNDSDLGGITGDCVSIYLATGNYVYRLQSCAVDVTFERQDIKEIGDKDVVSRGVKNITTRVTLGRIIEAYTIEAILRGEASSNFGKIDMRELLDTNTLTIKLYSDNTKTTFKMGYQFTDLAPTGMDAATPVNDYINRNVTLEGEAGLITSLEASLAAEL